MLAILQGVKHFHTFLANNRFEVLTDHISLTWMDSLKLGTGRLYRWALQLQEYSFDVTHVKGQLHVLADAMSRIKYPKDSKDDAEKEFDDLLMNLQDAVEETTREKEKPRKTLLVRFKWP